LFLFSSVAQEGIQIPLLVSSVISCSNRFGFHRLAVQQRARLLWLVNSQAASLKNEAARAFDSRSSWEQLIRRIAQPVRLGEVFLS
jgi:hypothetical protein